MPFQLSTRGRYGVRAVSRLAMDYDQGPQSIKHIATEENIPLRNLEQIMNQLRKEGIVNSIRGRLGGYKLSGPPGSFTVARVIESLEGDVLVVHCLHGGGDSCERSDVCISKKLWEDLNGRILLFLRSITLQNLVDGYNEKKITDFSP